MAYVIVDGEVTRTFFEGKGVAFKETFKKRDGSEGAAYYSAFFQEPHGLAEGAKGTFKGNLSTKAREYEDKDGQPRTSVDVTLNNTKFEPSDDQGETSPF